MISRYYGSRRILECLEISEVIGPHDNLESVISTKISLREWMKQDNNNLELFKNIIIDVDSLVDYEIDDLIENIESIQILSDAKIILVMSKKDTHYINTLIENGVYNIIYVTEQDTKTQIANEFKKAFSVGGITKFKETYEKEKEKTRDIYSAIKKKEEIETAEEDVTKKETQKIGNLRVKNNEKNVKIAFCGLEKNVGTTTMALNLCSFLSKRGLKVAYAESNLNRDLHYITRFYVSSFQGEYYDINGIHFYVNDLMEQEYDVIVVDYGYFSDENKIQVFSQDIRFIIGMFSPKKLVEFNEKRKKWKESSVIILSYEVDEFMKDMISGIKDEKIVFLKHSTSLFDDMTNEEAWFNNISNYFEISD